MDYGGTFKNAAFSGAIFKNWFHTLSVVFFPGQAVTAVLNRLEQTPEDLSHQYVACYCHLGWLAILTVFSGSGCVSGLEKLFVLSLVLLILAILSTWVANYYVYKRVKQHFGYELLGIVDFLLCFLYFLPLLQVLDEFGVEKTFGESFRACYERKIGFFMSCFETSKGNGLTTYVEKPERPEQTELQMSEVEEL